jgi:putative membrane protein
MTLHRHGSIVVGVLCGTLVLTIAPARANTTTEKSSTSTPAADSGDATILTKLVTVDQNEIKIARTAEKKKISPAALNYARMLRDQHQQNLSDTQKLSHKLHLSPRQTSETEDIRKKGATELAQLQPLNGPEFERAFIEAMVKGHEEVLSMLDDGIASAKNDEVKAHLQSTREAVATHLSEAKQLQGGASASAGR